MLNAISYYEVRRGLLLPQFQRQRMTFERLTAARGVLPLNTPALDTAADLYQRLRSAGALIEDADILLASIALAHNAVLITRNTRHFERIEGLRPQNWEDGDTP
jgi:tRNA(fMet)-specific endonuclease VapC